jgi:tRNA(Ile)-lysidine synthase
MRKLSKTSGQRADLLDLLERVEKMIRVRRLFRRGQAILVAVSGGLDSTALLHVLYELAPANGWRLSVAHLNHRLRGRSSDADERLVRSICEKFALPLFVKRTDVRQIAREQKISIEMAARKARHEFLARVAARKKISTIALAHHADDQVELFFIRLFRGSGGEGLAGMKWRNAFPGAKGIEIVRPLLGESKSALCEFARANKVKFREDATNAWLDILRNRIRHELLPLLRRNYQPALNKVVLRLMDILAEEADLARVMAEDWTRPAGRTKYRKLNRQFSDLPVAVQRRCLQIHLLAEGVSPVFELIEKLRLNPDTGVSIEQPGPSKPTILRDSSGYLQWQTPEAIQFDSESRKLSLRDTTGQTTFDGIGIRWQNQHKPGLKRPKLRQRTEYFDAELIGSKVILRHWRKGDRFQPIGIPAAVKLQDLFVNQKVPRALRHQLVVAATEKGEIFWVEGLRISERFQLTKQTKRRLQWQWTRD